jgi:hypothetical protein
MSGGAPIVPQAVKWPSVTEDLKRVASTFVRETPLNPLNVASALLHPLDTISSLVVEPVQHAASAVQHGVSAVRGVDARGNEIPSRLGEAEQLVSEGIGAIPLVGPAIYHAADKIAGGDYAGGVGSVLATASGAFAPEATSATGRGVGAVGRGLEVGSLAAQKLKPVPQFAALDALLHASPKMAAVAAAPYAGEYAGRGLQRTGRAMQRAGAYGRSVTRSRLAMILDALGQE